MEKAIEILSSRSFHGRQCLARRAVEDAPKVKQTLTGKKRGRASAADYLKDAAELVARDGSALTVIDRVAPYHRVDYDEQIRCKQAHLSDILSAIFVGMKDAYMEMRQPMPSKLRDAESVESMCPFEGVTPPPKINEYRNKMEFTFGVNQEENPELGFQEGLFRTGVMTIGDPTGCPLIPMISLTIRESVLAFVKNGSRLPVYTKENHKGCWRGLTIRTNRMGESLILLQVCSNDVERAIIEDEVRTLCPILVESLAEQKHQLQGLVMVYNNSTSNAVPSDAEYVLMHGNDHFAETLHGMRFRVTVNSFFQVNTLGAEVLYGIIREWVGGAPVVLDVCSGTGTIGLLLSKAVEKVIGVEMVESAVNDAKENAKENKIENCEFICGKAETVLTTKFLESRVGHQRCVAVVDPPRSGLHKNVIRSLRACRSIERIIYISCNQGPLIENAVSFCRPVSSNTPGVPFLPTRAIGVDMFPHTEHVEFVVQFERIM
jgi:tRNA (uracil-5-)-methyltransferase